MRKLGFSFLIAHFRDSVSILRLTRTLFPSFAPVPAALRMFSPLPVPALPALPAQFDVDGDGAITTEELRSAMSKLLGQQMKKGEIDDVIREADNNGDGTVDFEGEARDARFPECARLLPPRKRPLP